MSVNGSIATGVIDVMRQLSADEARPAAVLAGETASHARCLGVLRDIYGAAEETARGWRLRYAPDWLSPAALPADSILIDELDSTQLYCRQQQQPCAVFTEHQTAGIGRKRGGWFGLPADALSLSLLLPAPMNCSGLSVALGAMLCTVLAPPRTLYFKWPNDIVNTRYEKIAGIIAEVKGARLIIGIGVNWRLTPTFRRYLQAQGKDARPAALTDSITDHIGSGDRSGYAVRIAATVRETVAAYDGGFSAFRAVAEMTHAAAIGDSVRAAGQWQRFMGFADDGALILANGGQHQHHRQGGVEYVASC